MVWLICIVHSKHLLGLGRWEVQGRYIHEGKTWRGDTRILCFFYQLSGATSWNSIRVAGSKAPPSDSSWTGLTEFYRKMNAREKIRQYHYFPPWSQTTVFLFLFALLYILRFCFLVWVVSGPGMIDLCLWTSNWWGRMRWTEEGGMGC